MSKQKEDGGVGIAIDGAFRHNRRAFEVRCRRIARLGVEDVVVERAVLLKAALVQATGNQRAIAGLHRGDNVVLLSVRVLHAHIPGIAIKALSHHVHVAAQAERGVFATALAQHLYQVICDIALGDAAQIELGIWIGKGDGGVVNLDAAIIDMGQRRLNGSVVGFYALDKIPQARDGSDGDVE